MNKIIVVGDYSREDFCLVGKILKDDFEIIFLEYLSETEVKNSPYKKWGRAIFWKDYKSAVQMIDEIRPAFVLFYFIESFNHVALNVACRFRGIKTFHIEHGIRYFEIQEYYNSSYIPPAKFNLGDKLKKLGEIGQVWNRLKGRFFYNNTISELPKEQAEFLKAYFSTRSSSNIFETFREVRDPLRIADTYISFSPEIFKFHIKSDHLPENYPVHFIGCPSFDYLVGCDNRNGDAADILFVDNAFESQDLFGWTRENKKAFLDELLKFCQQQKRKLWIKIHPYSNSEVYSGVGAEQNVSLISTDKEVREVVTRSAVVIGFYSTLLMPLMALEHTTCFSLEMHPADTGFKFSSFLVETGAIKEAGSWEELKQFVGQLSFHHAEQKKHKQKFIQDWLYKFDGRSGERLKNILLSEVP
jgi:hypothetical protein